MILNYDELAPLIGSMPVNDGQSWRSRPTQVFSQTTAVTLTAAAAASVISTVACQGSPTIAANVLNRIGATLVVKFGGYATTPGAGQGNLTLGIYLGGSCIATTKATALVASQTTIGYYGEVRVTTLTLGASGTVQATGFVALATLSAVLDPVFTNGTTIGTQAPATPPTVALNGSLLIDVQSVLSTAVNTLVNTNATFEIVF
jgi:hypothetical protein